MPTLVNSRSPIPVQAERMARIDDAIVRLQARISTGERFTTPSEDPAAANRAALLNRLQERLTAENRSLDRATARLSFSETATTAAADALLRARELTLTAANGTASAEDRQVILAEVKVLREQLLDSANARDDGGRYLFAGSRNGNPAYGPDANGAIIWLGFGDNGGAEAASVGTASAPRGPDLFGDAQTGAFATLDRLALALEQSDTLLRNPELELVLDGLEAGHERLLVGRASIGAGLARLEGEANRIESARLDLAEGLANTKGLDLTAAIAELAALQLTQSAAQQSFASIFEGSLFDRLG